MSIEKRIDNILTDGVYLNRHELEQRLGIRKDHLAAYAINIEPIGVYETVVKVGDKVVQRKGGIIYGKGSLKT